jgi:hypothetical protein
MGGRPCTDHNVKSGIFSDTMKPHFSPFFALMFLPAMAHALEAREPPVQTLVVDASASDASGSPRLRDALRQSGSEGESKPYRLSEFERQRLREQLRGQADAKGGK